MSTNNDITAIRLTIEQTKLLQGMTEELTKIDRELKKAELAGIDVVESRKIFEENKKKRLSLIKYYGRTT